MADMQVAEVMQPLERIQAVEPETPAAEALTSMLRDDVNQLPVIVGGHLEGMVSRTRNSAAPSIPSGAAGFRAAILRFMTPLKASILSATISVMAAAGPGCLRTPDPMLTVTRPENLETGDEALIGRPIAFDRIRVTGAAAAGGFYIGVGNRHVYVLPDRDGVTVAAGEMVSLTGVIERMRADIASRLDLAQANYDIYIHATHVKSGSLR